MSLTHPTLQTSITKNEGSMMEIAHWIGIVVATAVMAVAWLLVMPLCRNWKPLNDRMADQSTRSAELVKECSATTARGTSFGRLSTIR